MPSKLKALSAKYSDSSEGWENLPGLLSLKDKAAGSAYEMYPGQTGDDDQRDAARHMLAAGYLSKKYSPKTAERLGMLHELTGAPIQTLRHLMSLGAPRNDYKMDEHNNRVGAELVQQATSFDDFERLVNQAAEDRTLMPLEGRAYVQPQNERERLRYMEKYADGGSVQAPTNYDPATVDNLIAQFKKEHAYGN